MESVFKEIEKNQKEKIYGLCKTFVYDVSQADDLYQEVMINLWKNSTKFQKRSQLSTWIYKITLNTSINFNLKENRRKTLIETFFQRVPKLKFEIPQILEEESEDKRKLYNEIESLKNGDKYIIRMYLDEMSYKEIAEVIGVSVNSIGVKVSRIKEKLKNKLS